ncbi:MAG: helix-turn-helix transcriptional regulator [Caldilineaceae bacterium]
MLASELTFREMDVLALIAQQKTNDEIADQLVIALPTVKRHTTSIFKKLGVTNRRQATARAGAGACQANAVTLALISLPRIASSPSS